MLHIRIKNNDEKVLTNVHKEFAKLDFKNTSINSKLLKEIEGGTYKDSTHFIDRFNDKVPTSFLSSGCKAAIVVASHPDREIDITEAGINARDSIIRNIKDGYIAMYYPGSTITYGSDDSDVQSIDVELDGYRFTSLKRLNYYIKEEMGWEPDMNLEGISKVNN